MGIDGLLQGLVSLLPYITTTTIHTTIIIICHYSLFKGMSISLKEKQMEWKIEQSFEKELNEKEKIMRNRNRILFDRFRKKITGCHVHQ
jgi:hypothetical protein